MTDTPARQEMPPVVVLCLSPTGLSVARSLAPRGIAVYGIDRLRWEIGHYSRWIRHDAHMSYLPAGPELLEAMIRFARTQAHQPVIFHAGDPYIDFIAEHREVLCDHFLLTDSMRPEANSVFLNKKTFYQCCLSLGIDLPKTFFPSTEDEARAAARDLRYPAIVKPVHGYLTRTLLRGRKLVEVHSADELVSWWATMQRWGTDAVLQEVIAGPESNIVVAGLYMDRQSRCKSLFTGRKIRQYPPVYGSGSYMVSEWLPEIADLSIHIVQQLRYHGVCGTEFKWDSRSRSWKLIEVNCRPTLWFALTRAAGVDVIWDAYCDLIGRGSSASIGRQKDGIRWQLLFRDLVSSTRLLRAGELGFGDFLHTTLDPRHKVEGVLSFRDWRANFGYVVNTAMQCYRHFLKRARKPAGGATAQGRFAPRVLPPMRPPAGPT